MREDYKARKSMKNYNHKKDLNDHGQVETGEQKFKRAIQQIVGNIEICFSEPEHRVITQN